MHLTRSMARGLDIQANTPCPGCGHLTLKLTSYIPADSVDPECWTGFCRCARDNKDEAPLSMCCDAPPRGETESRNGQSWGVCDHCGDVTEFTQPCPCEWES